MKILVMVFSVMMASGQPAEKLLESARHKEVMGGDLKGAIAEYRKIAERFAKQPEVAAQALLRMGECQEKLGEAEARKSYERVVKEYAGAGAVVVQARARLAAMGGGHMGEPRTRLVWDNAIDLWGTASADGRLLSFTDWSTGDLAVRDLTTGQHRRVTDKGGYVKSPKGETWGSAISPDGKRIAFTWALYEWKTERDMELRVIGADGKGERLLKTSNGFMEPQDWSPDGKWIAVMVREGKQAQRDNQVVLLSADTSESRVLPTRNQGVKGKLTFSPDGKWLAYSSGQENDRRVPILYSLPTDGSAEAETILATDARMMGWTPDGKGVLFVRERGGVNLLFYLPVANGKATGEPQQIRAASAAGDTLLGVTKHGTLLYGIANQQTDAVVAEFDNATGRIGKTILQFPARSLGGSYGGGSVKFSPDGTKFLCTVSLKAILIHSMADGTEHTVVLEMRQMRRVEWSHDGTALLVSGTANDGRDGIYQVDPSSGRLTFLTDIAPAVVFAQTPDGKQIYYRKQGSQTDVLAVRDLTTGSDKVLIDNNVYTTVNFRFSRDGKKLAMGGGRYLGILDLATGQVKDLYKPVDAKGGPRLDGLDWTGDDRFIVTLMRVDGKNGEAWRFPVEGGEPSRQPLPVYSQRPSISADGKYLGMLQTQGHNQVWALENFLPTKK